MNTSAIEVEMEPKRKFNSGDKMRLIDISAMIFIILFIWIFNSHATDLMVPSKQNPGKFANSEVPQLVVIGSDDNTSAEGLRWMIGELAKRTNKDGTPLRMSFYSVTSNWDSNSELVNAHREAYAAKHEIGNHTFNHPYCVEWGADTIIKTWSTNELVAQQLLPVKEALLNDVGLNSYDLYGFRTPYLGYSNNTFSAMEEIGIVYDCSIMEGDAGNAYWPYTLDTKNSNNAHYAPGLPNWWISGQNKNQIVIGKHAGLWELPAYHFKAPADVAAYMDTKVTYQTGGWVGGLDYNLWARPGGGFAMNKEQSLATLKNTFDKMYKGNRTPMTVGVHSQYYVGGTNNAFPKIKEEADRKAVFTEFLDYCLEFDNVWFVTGAQVIEYCRNPVKAGVFNPDEYLPENIYTSGLPKFTLNVENGSGDGDYCEGAKRTIVANDAPLGQVFDVWTGDVDSVADVNSSTTLITMGASAITVVATYKDEKVDTIIDTTNSDTSLVSDNLVVTAAWRVYIDGYGESAIDTANSIITSDNTVKAAFSIGAADVDAKKWTYGSMEVSLNDDMNFEGLDKLTIEYKSSAAVNVSLPQKPLSDIGTSYRKEIPKASTFNKVTLSISDFKQPSWLSKDQGTPLNLSIINSISFDMTTDGGSQDIEISKVFLYGVDGVTPIMSEESKVAKVGAKIHSVDSRYMDISISLPGDYSLSIYTVNGRLVRDLGKSWIPAGRYMVKLGEAGLGSQIYVVCLEGMGMRTLKKAVIR